MNTPDLKNVVIDDKMFKYAQNYNLLKIMADMGDTWNDFKSNHDSVNEICKICNKLLDDNVFKSECGHFHHAKCLTINSFSIAFSSPTQDPISPAIRIYDKTVFPYECIGKKCTVCYEPIWFDNPKEGFRLGACSDSACANSKC